MKTGRWLVISALLLVSVGCSAQRKETAHGAAAAAERPVLYDSLGNYSYRITTRSAEAQRWFNQGLRLVYAFNHHEAEKAFREAGRVDPACAMCFWGIALTQGSNYNSPTDADREKAAVAAVQEAQRLASGATPQERALIAQDAPQPVGGLPLYNDIPAALASLERLAALRPVDHLLLGHEPFYLTGDAAGKYLAEGAAFIRSVHHQVERARAQLGPPPNVEALTREVLDGLGKQAVPAVPMICQSIEAHLRWRP